MGIKKYAVDQVGALELRGPTDDLMVGDDGQKMVISFYGPGSTQYAKAQSDLNNRAVDRLRRKGKTEQSAEDKAHEQAVFFAACTKSFSPNIGTDYPGLAGNDLYMALYTDRELGFVADQVTRFLGDWANFTKTSTAS